MPFRLLPLLLVSCLLAHDPGLTTVPVDESLQKSIAWFKQRLDKNPQDMISLGRLGDLYLKKARHTARHDDFQLAQTCFERLLALDTSSVHGRIGMSRALLGQHHFARALDQARIAGARKPQDPATWALIGDIHLALGHYLEAEMFFIRLHDLRVDLQSLSRRAQIYEVRGNFEMALRYYHDALKQGQKDQRPATELAWCLTMIADLHLESGELDEAAVAFRKALKQDGHTHYADWGLARIAFYRKQLKEAEGHIREALNKGGHLPRYRLTEAQILQGLGHDERARKVLADTRHHLHHEIKAGDQAHLREWVLLNLKDPATALKAARQDLEAVRQDVMAYVLAGWCAHLTGQHDEAAGYMDRAIAPGLSTSEILFRAGIAYHAAGQKLKARHLLMRGRQRGGPVPSELEKEALALLEQMEKRPEAIHKAFIKPQ